MQNQTSETTTEVALEQDGVPILAESACESSPEGAAGIASHTAWEVVVGTIAGLVNSSEPLVNFPLRESGSPVKTRSLVPIRPFDVGRQVVLAFEDGDSARPIVLGLLQTLESAGANVDIEVDGDRLVIHAQREIALRCGKASITLTRAGKVLIQGEYVLTRARGVNRIKGAAVSIN